MAIGEAIARRGIQKRYWLETRADVLLRNKEVFQLWARLGLEDHVHRHRGHRRGGPQEVPQARQLRRRTSRRSSSPAASASTSRSTSSPTPTGTASASASSASGAREIPEIVNISVNTPYPGTETWLTEARKLATRATTGSSTSSTRCCPTKLPLPEFYEELVATQQVLNRKHLGARQIWGAAKNVAAPARPRADELPQDALQVQQRLRSRSCRSPTTRGRSATRCRCRRRRARPRSTRRALRPPGQGRRGREIDDATERFVDDTRMGVAD